MVTIFEHQEGVRMQKLFRLNIKTLLLFSLVLAGMFVYLNVHKVKKRSLKVAPVLQEINTSELTKYGKFFLQLEQENYTKTLINIADQIKTNAGVILLAMVNDAFITMTNSWLCNVKPFGIHKHVLFITTDKNSQKMIKYYWPDVAAVYIATLDIHGDQEYSKVGYVKMMHLRTQIIRVLLEHGFTLLLFETDCLWIENPLPDIKNHANNSDIVVAKPTHKHGYLGGFQLLISTGNTLKFYNEFSQMMWKLYNEISSYAASKSVPDYHNDQVYFSNLLEGKYKYLKLGILSPDKYIDGKWYIDYSEERRKQLKPYIINNNWVKGNSAKIARAKKWGHWFWHRNNTCDEHQVNKVIRL